MPSITRNICAGLCVIRVITVAFAAASIAVGVYAEEKETMKELTVGNGIRDARAAEKRDTNWPVKMPKYSSKEEWLARRAFLRDQILMSAGLLPMPEKCPLNAEVFGKIERQGYTIEKVHFESHPGFLATGNLYRPTGKKGPFPGLLCPHGHWGAGRFGHEENGSVPGRCINFARQGYVVFSYDMVGYNDSRQVPHHFDSERGQLWGITVFGLQTWNSVRALDFLLSLPDVDPERVGCTGASGGGTQTFILYAIDDRLKANAPVCMISSTMQGGCICENGPGLRVGTNNMEIGAMAAPRPLLMVAATGDWTKNTREVEFPAVKSVYSLFGAEDKITCAYFDAPHNYNKNSREAAYAFFGKWLLGVDDPDALKEQPFEVEKKEDALVFPDGKLPAKAITPDQLTKNLMQSGGDRLENSRPRKASDLAAFRNEWYAAFRHSVGAETPAFDRIEARQAWTAVVGDCMAEALILSRNGVGDAIPALIFTPKGQAPTSCALLVDGIGKRAFLNADATGPGELITALLQKGVAVMAIDCFRTGEAAAERRTDTQYFTTYLATDTSCRIQDILTSLSYLRGKHPGVQAGMVGQGDAGAWVLLALGLAEGVGKTAADCAGFDNGSDAEFARRIFLPCLRRVGDFRTAVALAAPSGLMLHNTAARFKTGWIEQLYKDVGAPGSLCLDAQVANYAEIAAWLTTK
ncbi:MAG TPA: acetylxylan esterase [Candidatus Brocadiia bacterium]|nr:acetylxylan esterase [Candidatus Brocadiia bacterium]